jgi:copper transport protein
LAAIILAITAVALHALVTAPMAAAHAALTSSEPADRAQLSEAPDAVTLSFSEPVRGGEDALSVLDDQGERIGTGGTTQPSPTSLRAELPQGMDTGAYVATYRVISADGHPIRGSVVFSVGDASLDDATGIGDDLQAGPVVIGADRVGHILLFAGALMAAGVTLFVAFAHDGQAGRSRLHRVVQAGAGLAVVSTLIVFATQVALAGTMSTVVRGGLGRQSAALAVGLGLCLWSSSSRAPASRARVAAAAGGLLTAVSFVLWGHATQAPRPWLAVSADAVHLIGAAVWFGGLVALAIVLTERGRSLGSGGVDPTRPTEEPEPEPEPVVADAHV